MDTKEQEDIQFIVKEEQRFTYSKATRILLSDSRITNLGILAMIGLGMHTNDAGFCYPTIKTLCQWSRLSPNSLRKGLKELEDCGYLNIEYRKNPDNPKENLPNLYTVFPYHKSLHSIKAPSEGGVPHQLKEGTSPREGGVPHQLKGNYTQDNYTHKQHHGDDLSTNKSREKDSLHEELCSLLGDSFDSFSWISKYTVEASAELSPTEIPYYAAYLVNSSAKKENKASYVASLVKNWQKTVETFRNVKEAEEKTNNAFEEDIRRRMESEKEEAIELMDAWIQEGDGWTYGYKKQALEQIESGVPPQTALMNINAIINRQQFMAI